MAIQATITTTQGVLLSTAYINLGTPQINKERQEDGTNKYTLGSNACVYSNKEYYDACILAKVTPIPVEGFSVVCGLDLDVNALEQGYAELKRSERLENITEA